MAANSVHDLCTSCGGDRPRYNLDLGSTAWQLPYAYLSTTASNGCWVCRVLTQGIRQFVDLSGCEPSGTIVSPHFRGLGGLNVAVKKPAASWTEIEILEFFEDASMYGIAQTRPKANMVYRLYSPKSSLWSKRSHCLRARTHRCGGCHKE